MPVKELPQTFREIWTSYNADHIVTNPKKVVTWYDYPDRRYYRVTYHKKTEVLRLEEVRPRISRHWTTLQQENVKAFSFNPQKILERVNVLLKPYRDED